MYATDNRYHDLVMICVSLGDIAILIIKGGDYCCIIRRISKSDALKLMQNIDLTKKV